MAPVYITRNESSPIKCFTPEDLKKVLIPTRNIRNYGSIKPFAADNPKVSFGPPVSAEPLRYSPQCRNADISELGWVDDQLDYLQ